MFDVGLSEMMVIAVVALVVIGPERLPRVARTLGHLVGRMQRYVNDVKADINREIELDELRKFKDQFQDAAQGVENTIRSGVDEAKTEVESAASTTFSSEAAPADPTALAVSDAGPVPVSVAESLAISPVDSSSPAKSVT